jgi:hypothetical protein
MVGNSIRIEGGGEILVHLVSEKATLLPNNLYCTGQQHRVRQQPRMCNPECAQLQGRKTLPQSKFLVNPCQTEINYNYKHNSWVQLTLLESNEEESY